MEAEGTYDYDLFVIGAGSGGLSAAKAAASYGKKVAICDFVKPSPQGTSWGIGGTCVNVGCIPKKLMHFAAQVGDLRQDQQETGWEVDTTLAHNWERMQANVGNYIKGLNWGYKKELMGLSIKVLTKLGKVMDAHTVQLTDKKGKQMTVTADKILVAVGGRPIILDVPGKEHCITSDDVFWMPKSPGKTLVIGAGYIALECGGFLSGLGNDVSIMVRSIALRGFDQDMVARITDNMVEHGVRFLQKSTPDSFEKLESGKILAKWTSVEDGSQQHSEEFDTVLMGVGRAPDTANLGLESAGLTLVKGRVQVDQYYQTSVPSIYAIGDIIIDSPELTPVAIREGKITAQAMYGDKTTIKTLNYDLIATTVFTPLEYASIGLSEDKAVTK